MFDRSAYPADANFDEVKVVDLSLPAPLVLADGRRVTDPAAWWGRRRPEISRLFEQEVFGGVPGAPDGMSWSATAEDDAALGGVAIRREAAIVFGEAGPKLNILLYLPKRAAGPLPMMLGPNFLGNHTIHADPGIALPDISFAPGMDVALAEGRATEASRGLQADRWAVERVIERGYALATFYYGDLFPDRADGRALSIQPFVDRERRYGWGAIATWSWAMSRALDALAEMPEIDSRRVALVGHSRHGKAALWAGALDQRFRLVIANNSGKGGASLMRRNFGETIRHLVTRYPHWFAEPYARYADREAALPVDQHMLIALIAPRPVYIASAVDDLWADPTGEFLGAQEAGPVYRLLGEDGLDAQAIPALGRPAMSRIGYHIRPGGHGVTAWDWERFLDFADRHMT